MFFLLILFILTISCANQAQEANQASRQTPRLDISSISVEEMEQEEKRLKEENKRLELEIEKIRLQRAKESRLIKYAVLDSIGLALIIQAGKAPIYSDEYNRYMRELSIYTAQQHTRRYLNGAFDVLDLQLSFLIAEEWDAKPRDILEKMGIAPEEKKRVLEAIKD